MAYASRKDMVGRGVDGIKSARGESTTRIDSLEIDRSYKGGLDS
jgi:twitching motility protein PilT